MPRLFVSVSVGSGSKGRAGEGRGRDVELTQRVLVKVLPRHVDAAVVEAALHFSAAADASANDLSRSWYWHRFTGYENINFRLNAAVRVHCWTIVCTCVVGFVDIWCADNHWGTHTPAHPHPRQPHTPLQQTV